MRRSMMSSGSSSSLAIPQENMTGSGTFPDSVINNEYDNSKRRLRRDSHPFEQRAPRSPAEIISSIRDDFTWSLARDLVLSAACYLFGVHGPKRAVLPLLGGLTVRPIPYQVTAAGDVLLDLALANDLTPKSDVAFTSEKLWFISLWLPMSIMIFLGAIFPLNLPALPNNKPLLNIHAGTCTILVAIGISELVTQTFKFYVGRLRPNFYALCGFDKNTLQCTNNDKMQMEARMSFPSGHSSLSFCGLACLVLFFLGRMHKCNAASGRGKILIIVSFTPLLLSFWCATSRLVDNWHHSSDIIAGSILGTVSACISYHIWFPHLGAVYSGIPLSAIPSGEDGTNQIGSDFLFVEKSPSLPVC